MTNHREDRDARIALALELELGSGRHGASARVELLEWAGEAKRVARVTLRGWIGGAAQRRLERAFVDLAARDVDHVVLDCRRVLHLGDRVAHRLVDAASRFEAGTGRVEVWGLSGRLSRRLAAPRVRCWPRADDAAGVQLLEPAGEYAS